MAKVAQYQFSKKYFLEQIKELFCHSSHKVVFFSPCYKQRSKFLRKTKKGKKPWNQEDDEETLLSIRRTNLRIIIEILILYALVYINANQLILWDIVLTVCRPQRNDFDNTNTIKNKLPDKIKERHVGSKAYISS